MPLSKTLIPCASCGSPVEVEMAQPRLMNMETCALMVIEHGTQFTCPSCGTTVTPAVKEVQGIQIVAVPVPKAQQQLIVPPSPLRGFKQ